MIDLDQEPSASPLPLAIMPAGSPPGPPLFSKTTSLASCTDTLNGLVTDVFSHSWLVVSC